MMHLLSRMRVEMERAERAGKGRVGDQEGREGVDCVEEMGLRGRGGGGRGWCREGGESVCTCIHPSPHHKTHTTIISIDITFTSP